MRKFILTTVTLFFAANIFGQSVPFLNISADPYTFSMGGNTLTLDADAFTITNNSSAMSFAEESGYYAASYTFWQPGIVNNQMISASGFNKIGNIAFGINGKYYTHTPYDITDESGFVSGQYTPIEISAEAAASYKILNILSIGANVRYVSSMLAENNPGAAISADISASFRLGSLRAAAAVTNIGTQIDYGYTPYQLPAMAKLGVGYAYRINDNNAVGIHAEGDYLLYKGGVMAALGAEYKFKEMVAVRAGYHLGNENAIPSYASAGVGVHIFGVDISAAYVIGFNNSPINGSLMASIGYSF